MLGVDRCESTVAAPCVDLLLSRMRGEETVNPAIRSRVALLVLLLLLLELTLRVPTPPANLPSFAFRSRVLIFYTICRRSATSRSARLGMSRSKLAPMRSVQ